MVKKLFKGDKTLIVWCNKPELKITSDVEPCTCVQKILPTDSPLIKKDKKRKPYINKKRVLFTVDYLGSQYCILVHKGYTWDGASIPVGFRWLIGAKGSPEFLNASMIHDKMCENHEIVDFDRQLSSMIFRELLIASGVGKVRAQTMYLAVDNFQRFCGWKEK